VHNAREVFFHAFRRDEPFQYRAIRGDILLNVMTARNIATAINPGRADMFLLRAFSDNDDFNFSSPGTNGSFL